MTIFILHYGRRHHTTRDLQAKRRMLATVSWWDCVVEVKSERSLCRVARVGHHELPTIGTFLQLLASKYIALFCVGLWLSILLNFLLYKHYELRPIVWKNSFVIDLGVVNSVVAKKKNVFWQHTFQQGNPQSYSKGWLRRHDQSKYVMFFKSSQIVRYMSSHVLN